MWVRAAAALCASVPLLAGCGDQSDAGQTRGSTTAGMIAKDSAVSAPAPAPTATATVRALMPDADMSETPTCPASDAWGKDPLGQGILVTVWSDRADKVTVLIRTRSGPDRARTGIIDAQDQFRMFAFPDVDHTAVAEVLILSDTERCYAARDPATAGG